MSTLCSLLICPHYHLTFSALGHSSRHTKLELTTYLLNSSRGMQFDSLDDCVRLYTAAGLAEVQARLA